MIKDFLPISRADMEARGWDQVDFVYVIGDASVTPLSVVFWKRIIIGWELFLSRTGKTKRVLMFLENPALDF